jgi:glycerol transport system substrate-binding protein
VMRRLGRAGKEHCAPELNPIGDPNKYLSDKGAPWKKLANEKPKGETIAYDTLLNAWKAGKGPLKRMGARCDSIEVTPRPPDA